MRSCYNPHGTNAAWCICGCQLWKKRNSCYSYLTAMKSHFFSGSVVLVLVCSRCTQREPEHRVTKTKPLLLLLSVHKCETGAKMDKNLPWDYVLWAANNVEEPPGLLLPQQRCNKARSWKNAWRFNRNWTAWVIIIFQGAVVPQFYTFWFASLCFLSYLGGAHFELSFSRRSHKLTRTSDHKAKVSLQLRWCFLLNEQQRRIEHSFCQAYPPHFHKTI